MLHCPAHRWGLLAIVMLPVACGDGGQGPSPALYTGQTADQAGDNSPHQGLATTPDLVLVKVEIRNGMIDVLARFAPGTLDAASEVNLGLDTDQDALTGDQGERMMAWDRISTSTWVPTTIHRCIATTTGTTPTSIPAPR